MVQQSNIRLRQRGVSLIELMISMTLGLLIIIAIGYVYLGAKSSFNSQNAMATIQENARYAFEFIGSDVRMAGFNGGPTDGIVTQPVSWADQKDLKNFPLRGFKAGVSTFPTFPISRPRLSGDALTVVRIETDSELPLSTAVNPNPNALSVFTLTSWPSSPPQVGTIMVGADYTHAAAFAVTAINSGSSTITTTDDVSGFNGAIAARRLFPVRGLTYYIATNPAGEPALYRLKLNATGGTTAEELVEGVQDMQITYGVDYSDPAASTNITNATWASGVVTFTSAAHGLLANDLITISGVVPSAFNGNLKITSSTTDTFTVVVAASPGTYASGGTVQRIGDHSVDAYWTADAVDSGSFGGNTIPGAATQTNYWNHVLSVRVALTLTTKQTEKVSTTNTTLTKFFATTFAVRNRL